MAVIRIEEALGVRARCSAPFESEPWGYESPNMFLNVGVCVDTEMAPAELLRVLEKVEKEISRAPHRNPDGSYRDRDIDIDLIAVDSTVMATPELTLPHPRMHLRRFVLQPMAELMPQWHHPITGLTPSQMLAQIDGKA